MTISQLLTSVAQRLQPIANEAAALEARLLAQHAWEMTAEELLHSSNQAIDATRIKQLEALVVRRLRHEPMSQILGYKDFWKDRFIVTADVLTPRADSETLIEAVVKHAPDISAPLRILDLGTGSGCLLLSVLQEYRQATGIGIDASEKALKIAKMNAERLQMTSRSDFFRGKWCKPLDNTQKFDIILSNPPYIAHGAIASLMPEVQGFEPHLALDGGEDGLKCYREIFAEIGGHVHANTLIVVEIGESQQQDVTAIAASCGLVLHDARHDLGGHVRALVFYPVNEARK